MDEARQVFIRAGITSMLVAEHVYQVVYDPKTFLVDAGATAARREQFLQGRIQRGKPFSAFTGGVVRAQARRQHSLVLRHLARW
jgi:hypothetical protein